MRAALPRSEYYDGSAPPAPSAGIAPIPIRYPWEGCGPGTHAGGSHVHCCPVGGLGIRLYPCGIATATVVDNSLWPPSPDYGDPAWSSPPVMRDGCAPRTSPNPPG